MKTRETLDGESDDGVEVQYSALGRGSPNVNTDDVQTLMHHFLSPPPQPLQQPADEQAHSVPSILRRCLAGTSL